MNEINVRLFQNLLLKVKNYRDLSETNFYQIKRDITDKPSLEEITKVIKDDSLEIEMIYNDYEAKERDHLKYKTDLSRLYVEVQKQTVLNTRLKSINNKNKKEYEDELAEYNLNMKMHLKSKIDVRFKKVAEKDKSKFINQQIKIASEKCANQETKQFSKRIEKSDAYYMSLCKRIFINYILSENIKNASIQELIDRNNELKKRFRDSVNNLKMELYETKFCKSDVLLRLDGCNFRTGVDKFEMLQFAASIFDLLITVGYTFRTISKAEVTLKQTKFWAVNNNNSPGKPVNLRSPFRRRAAAVRPSVDVTAVDGLQSPLDRFALLKSERIKKNPSKTNSISDEGFVSLELENSGCK